MKKSYYLFNPGRMSRKDNTIMFTPVDEEGRESQSRYLPVEGIKNFYIFGSLDANSALYNFLGKHQISVHFFDYYEHYTGSFQPKEYLQAGKLLVTQVQHYLNLKKRISIAQLLIDGAAGNILKNLQYYQRRDRDLQEQISKIESLNTSVMTTNNIDELMGIEGNIRQVYYSAFDIIIRDFEMGNRVKQPPSNEINALISFGNMICYALCLDQIYHTQLNPTISFLHEPGARRFSLALDLAEIFKPLLVDRVIFKVLNKRQIQQSDFEHSLNGCLLKESGRRKFVQVFDERLNETIQHRVLGRKVSYKHLVKLECYKLAKHLLGIDIYQPFVAWW